MPKYEAIENVMLLNVTHCTDKCYWCYTCIIFVKLPVSVFSWQWFIWKTVAGKEINIS